MLDGIVLSNLAHLLVSTEPPLRWLLALVGAILFVLLIVGLAVYRSWVYEQELDSLLWKVDFKDVITSDIPVTGKASKVRHAVSWRGNARPVYSFWAY